MRLPRSPYIANHANPATCSRFSFGELLESKEYALKQIRSVYSGLKWGKGLSAIIHQVWELVDKIERENRLQGRFTLPILVVIGWAGNDVHGDFGYQGCTWIHSSNVDRCDADRKVAAEYVDKLYLRSLDGLVELSNDPVAFCPFKSLGTVTMETIPCHLPTIELAERGIKGISSSLLATGGKYDNYHLHNHQCLQVFNTNYATSFIKNDQGRREAVRLFPIIIQFRLAFSRTQEAGIRQGMRRC